MAITNTVKLNVERQFLLNYRHILIDLSLLAICACLRSDDKLIGLIFQRSKFVLLSRTIQCH